MHQVVLRVPQPRCCHLNQALQWVKRHGVWAHHSYASWRLPHHVSVDGATGEWCTDHATLFQHWADIVPAGHVQGYAFAKTLASLASGLALVLASKFSIIPKGVRWEWVSANGA